MLTPELLQKVKRIEITTRKIVDDVMTGQYRSHFKGHGVQFSEHRQYVPGDDIRHIDWKVSARVSEPLIKKFEEERELTVFLVVDVSASKGFGSSKKLKSEVAAEIAGMLAYAAVHTGDKVGVLLFSDRVERIIPPKKGRTHIQRIIRDVLAHKSPEPVIGTADKKKISSGTNLREALDATQRIMKHCGVVFLISDFMAVDYGIALRRLARRHDVVGVRVADEREMVMPSVGSLWLVDPESGQERFVDTSSYNFKSLFERASAEFELQTSEALKGGRVEWLRVLTKEDYAEAVVRFFRARSRKRR